MSCTEVEDLVKKGDVGYGWRRSSCVEALVMRGCARHACTRSTCMEAFVMHEGVGYARRSSSCIPGTGFRHARQWSSSSSNKVVKADEDPLKQQY